jgi:hypothetical protein
MGKANYATTVDLYGHLLDQEHNVDALDAPMAEPELAPGVPLRILS